MPILKSPVYLLQPGDVIRSTTPGERLAVLSVAVADPGPVGLQLARLGPIPAHLDRVATVSWEPAALVDVDRPELTPEQAEADALLSIVRQVARGVAPHPDTAQALVDKIHPPAPTLEEALATLAALDEICRQVQAGEADKDSVTPERVAARALLERARAAGVLPHV